MKIAWISDFNLIGSGYLNISIPLITELSKRGHEIKCAGLAYKGEEHTYPCSIIPAKNIQEAMAITSNLKNLWNYDAMVVALDVPVQLRILQMMNQKPVPYFGIMPIEGDPLCLTWAIALAAMDKAYIISEFGLAEAKKAGIQEAEYIQIGLDTDAWRFPTPEERKSVRRALFNADDEDFIVLTVADNQARKLLSRSMEIFADFAKDKEKVTYAMVTREELPIGWRLRDYAQELGISGNLKIFERGMKFNQLWSIYAASDCFLLTSKAEGLGVPLLEAMAVGVPCIGTNCTAIAEVLGEGRGFLIDTYECCQHRDPFGNSNRYFASREHGLELLNHVYENRVELLQRENCREYVEAREWNIAADQLETGLFEKVKDE